MIVADQPTRGLVVLVGSASAVRALHCGRKMTMAMELGLEMRRRLGRGQRSEEAAVASLATLVDAAILVSLVDGETTREELAEIDALVQGFAGTETDALTLRRLVEASIASLRADGWDERIGRLAAESRAQKAERQVLMVVTVLVHADGLLDPREEGFFFDLASALGFTEEEARRVAADVERARGGAG